MGAGFTAASPVPYPAHAILCSALLPVLSSTQEGGAQRLAGDLFSSLENARLPLRYMARMLSAGNEEIVTSTYKKMIAVRLYMRAKTVGDVAENQVTAAFAEAGITAAEAEEIYHLTSLPTYQERYVVPPLGREVSIEAQTDVQKHKGETGFGRRHPPRRGW